MKKILTERNLAAFLFVLVFIVFAFAHEDSKKRKGYYEASFSPANRSNSASLILKDVKKELVNTQQ